LQKCVGHQKGQVCTSQGAYEGILHEFEKLALKKWERVGKHVCERIQQVANGFQLKWMKICVVFDDLSSFLNKVDGWWTLRAWEIYSNSLKCPTIWKNLVRFFYLDYDREYS